MASSHSRPHLGGADAAIPVSDLEKLVAIDRDAWSKEADEQGEFLSQFGERLPQEIRRQHTALKERLSSVAV